MEYVGTSGQTQVVTVPQKQFVIIKPNVEHKLNASEGFKCYTIEFRTPNDAVDYLKWSNFVKNFPEAVDLINSQQEIFVYEDSESLHFSIYGFKKFFQRKTEYDHVLLDLKLKQLLVEILICKRQKIIPFSQRSNQIINKALQFIKSNFTHDIKLKDVANSVGLSAGYFQKLFIESQNERFSSYLNRQRINYSKDLLVNTNYSIKKISQLVGYKSMQNFIKNFKTFVPKLSTPARLRKETKEKNYKLSQDGMSQPD